MHMHTSAHKENFWTCRKRPSVLDIKGGGHLREVRIVDCKTTDLKL